MTNEEARVVESMKLLKKAVDVAFPAGCIISILLVVVFAFVSDAMTGDIIETVMSTVFRSITLLFIGWALDVLLSYMISMYEHIVDLKKDK